MKTNLTNSSLAASAKVQQRTMMASFGYALWMLVLLLGGGAFVHAATDCNLVAEIPVQECQSLVNLYTSTAGTNWTNNTNWNATNTPCSWAGITCSASGSPKQVTEINLSGNQLTGTLPDNLNLPALQWLSFDSNQLNGMIPNFNLPNLQVLGLSGNQFSGSIPNFNLPNLETLDLGFNRIDGTIPNLNLPNLKYLYLYSNQLLGSIPPMTLPALLELYLSSNQLTGAIPDNLMSSSPLLTKFYVDNNQLSGEIPTWVTRTSALNLDYNYLTASSSQVKQFLDNTYPGWEDRQKSPVDLTLHPLSDNLLLKNGSVAVTGTLSPALSTSPPQISNREVILTITPPTPQAVQTVSTRTDSTGKFTVTVKDSFPQAGTYTLQAEVNETTSAVQTLTVLENSGITLSEIVFPPNNTAFDKQLQMIAGKATDANQGTWIERVELTLQDQTTSQYLNLNSNTTSTDEIRITAEGTTEWFVSTDRVTWVPGHSYLITARAVDMLEEVSAEKTAQFTIASEKMPTQLSLVLDKTTLAPPENQIEATGTFIYTSIPNLPIPTPDEISKFVIRWELKTPEGGKVTGNTNLKPDGTFQFSLAGFDKIGGYNVQAFFDENETLQASSSNSENITMSSGKLEILHPANGSTVKTLPWISGQAYDPLIKEVKIAVKFNKTDENGKYKYLKLDNLGGRFEVVENDQPIWIPATGLTPWVVNVSKVILIDKQDYTLMAQAFDGSVPPQLIAETPPTKFTFDIDQDVQAFTSVALKLQSPTLLIGEPLNLTGKLDRYPYEGQDLNGRLLEVTIESPDQKITSIEVKTHDKEGHFELTDIAVFDREGTYRINASFAGDAVLSPAMSEPQPLLVGQTAGYAILVQGKTVDNEGLETHAKTVKRVYQQLKDRGLNDSNIYYFGYDDSKQQPGVDKQPSKAEIETVFTELGARISNVPAPLYVILVDHGGVGGNFYLNGDQKITATDLNNWLLKLEGGLTNDLAKQQPRVVVLGACYSGSFIRPLSKEGRIIITSVAENEVSYKGPVEPTDGIRTGELFVQELFDALGRDLSLAKAFEKAAETLRVYTRSGTPVSSNTSRRFFDDAIQHPLLDDNGDMMGSNVLTYSKDGRTAAEVYLGVNRVSQTRKMADISEVPAPVVYLSPQDQIFKPSLKVINAGRIKTATVDIRGPNEKLLKDGKEQTGQAQMKQLPRVFLSCNKGAPLGTVSECQTATQSLSQFEAPGKYDIFYFVNDTDPNYVSPLWHSVVYKAKEGNNPPTSVTLEKPANEGKKQTTLLFDWKDATDPDGDSLTYILLVAQDLEFNKLVYQQDQIRFSQSYMDGKTKVNVWNQNALSPTVQFGLKDRTDYYWKVIAVDNYGTHSPASEVFRFTTDNPNAPPDCGSVTPQDALGYSGNSVPQECAEPMIPPDMPPSPVIPGQIGFSVDASTITETTETDEEIGPQIGLQVDRVGGYQGKIEVNYHYSNSHLNKYH